MAMDSSGFTGPVGGAQRVISASMIKIAAAVAAAGLSIRGVMRGVRQALDLGAELNHLSAQTGETAGDLLVLRQAFEDTGVGAAALPTSLTYLRRALSGVDDAGQSTRDVFDNLGLDMEQLRGRSAAEQLDMVGKAIRALPAADDRVAAAARLAAEREAAEVQHGALRRDLAQLEAARGEAVAEWSALWRPLGVTPRSPREMAAWVRDFRSVAERAAALALRRTRAGRRQAAAAAACRALETELHRAGVADPGPEADLAALAVRARSALAAEEERDERRRQLVRDRRRQADELAVARNRLAEAETDLDHWRRQWAEAVRPLGLDGEALPAEAVGMVEDLKDLFDHLRDAAVLDKRIAGIDRDAAAFGEKAEALAGVVAPDLAGASAEAAVLALQQRLSQARQARSRRETLAQQIAAEGRRLEGAQTVLRDVDARLRGLCEEAGCAQVEALVAAERRSDERRRVEADLRRLADRLRQLSAGRTVAEFAAEARAEDPDTLADRIGGAEQALEALERRRSEADQAIGREQNELARMDGSGRAADLAEEMSRVLGGLAHDARHFARLRIASAVLQQAVERYRERHQGPILERTGAFFARITGERFAGVRAEVDDKGRPVLMGLRPDGTLLPVAGMSDGTADQLYLALRLAGIEAHLENGPPLPLVLDDVLIRFDDGRSAAALGVLAELSRRTQVVFFTHHRHLVELAARTLPADVLFVQELTPD